ncbi:MAG: YihY/virulence factor BrkB family protein [Bacteroidota bacterium]
MSRFKRTTERIVTWFKEHPLLHRVLNYSKEHSLPGFQGVAIYDVVHFTLLEFQRYDLFLRANSIAFSFFLSLFPSLLVLFTLVPFALNLLAIWFPELNEFQYIVAQSIQSVMPGQAGDMLIELMDEITSQPRIGLLSFGMILAIYFSSNGMMAMMRGFEKSYVKTFRRRGFLRKRLIAIGLTGLIGLFLFASTAFVILGDTFIRWLTDLTRLSRVATLLVSVSRWVIMLLLYYFTIGTLFRYGAATYRRFKYFSPGVSLATVLSLAASIAFSFYIDNFNRYEIYNKFYGSIATIIILMLWLQFNALFLLIGFELNASIAVNRDLREIVLEDEEAEEEEE